MRKLTTEEFIAKSKVVHGDKYDYSKVVYRNARSPVTIICPVHGEFKQITHDHMRGHGCPQCARATGGAGGDAPLGTVTFIAKAKAVHGDKYDYSKVLYKNNSIKVCIICQKHGEFWQRPTRHLHGDGCPVCGRIKAGATRSGITTENFIHRARKIHGEKYDYSESTYVDSKVPIKIICPLHGEFFQTADNHLRKKHGCPKCSPHATMSTEDFIAKARILHKGKYDYSEVEYKASKAEVRIICPLHGVFKQTPNQHLKGHGCPICGRSRTRTTTQDFIKKAIKVHGDTYDYSKVKYSSYRENVQIVCKKHGSFLQTPHKHLRGLGCPHCMIVRKPDKVYIFVDDLQSPNLMKIGISADVEKRLQKVKSGREATPFPVHLKAEFEFTTDTACEVERYMHNIFKNKNLHLSGFDGATEWFEYDESAEMIISALKIITKLDSLPNYTPLQPYHNTRNRF